LFYLGVDLGTSFLKGAVFDVEKRSLVSVRRVPFPAPVARLAPGRVEFDPTTIVKEVQALLGSLMEPGTSYGGLVMCSQMSCLILTDSKGNARSNCISWRDQRALESHDRRGGTYYSVLRDSLTKAQRAEMGNELSPGSPIAFLFRDAEKNLMEPGLVPLSLGDYVACALTGGSPGAEPTMAMAYNAFDISRGAWHEEVIAKLRLDGLQWPAVRRQGEIVGYLKGEAPIPCYTPVGDFQCALAGALPGPDELSLNISTGSQVSRLAATFTPGAYQTRPFFDGMLVNLYSHLPAGRSLNVLVGLLTEMASLKGISTDECWAYIEEAARAGETDLEVSLSFYPGPAGEEGFIRNIREANLTVGGLFRAAFSNMAQTYRRMALRLWPEEGWSRLVFSGGLIQKSRVLRYMILKEFNCAHRFSPWEEDALMGLLVLARVFSGRAESVMQEMEEMRAGIATMGQSAD
jgi:sugar (pentulose or hexulose) kinase